MFSRTDVLNKHQDQACKEREIYLKKLKTKNGNNYQWNQC